MWIHCILKRQNELFIPPGKQLGPTSKIGPPAGLDTKQTVGVGQRLSRCPGRTSHLKWSPQVPQDSKAAAGLLCQSLSKRGSGGRRQIQTETLTLWSAGLQGN